MGANKERARREQARQDKRAARRKLASNPEAPTGSTFGEVVAREGFVPKALSTTRTIIARTEEAIAVSAKRALKVISCQTCAAPKACCSLTTIAYLHEGVSIAARLRAEARDTPELRERLRASARLMETRPMTVGRNTCVFLDEHERCTVYEHRPTVCGTTFMSSPAENCSDPTKPIERFERPYAELSIEAERKFETEAGLPPLTGPYQGALPRMVLLCLEAWDRRDYVDFLAERTAIAARALRTATETG